MFRPWCLAQLAKYLPLGRLGAGSNPLHPLSALFGVRSRPLGHQTKQKKQKMLLQPSYLAFTVRRQPPELVSPAEPTPHELKLLSDLDDQNTLRFHSPFVYLFRYQPLMAGKDPVQVIREALAKTLVFYYPFAGRLRDIGPRGKLMVDCTGEGVLFIEANADHVTLEQFGNDPLTPFPCFDELLYNVPGSDGIIDCPLLLIQVTRLECGGFIFALRFNHTMCDGSGISQFLKAWAEIARGAPQPSILPVWHRELLCARDPPRVTSVHREYQQLLPLDTKSSTILDHRSFFFGPTEIAAIRALLPQNLAQSTSFEILTACIWRCRSKALYWQQNIDEEVRLLCVVNARYGRCGFNPPLPDGFYGNAFVFPMAVTTVRKLCSHPIGYALELVKKAKDEATEEYVHSVADLMAIKGRPHFNRLRSLMVSDISKAMLNDVDFGWGKAVYAGLPKGHGDNPELSFYVPFTNSKGEQGRVVLICLPPDAMGRFEKELDDMLRIKN